MTFAKLKSAIIKAEALGADFTGLSLAGNFTKKRKFHTEEANNCSGGYSGVDTLHTLESLRDANVCRDCFGDFSDGGDYYIGSYLNDITSLMETSTIAARQIRTLPKSWENFKIISTTMSQLSLDNYGSTPESILKFAALLRSRLLVKLSSWVKFLNKSEVQEHLMTEALNGTFGCHVDVRGYPEIMAAHTELVQKAKEKFKSSEVWGIAHGDFIGPEGLALRVLYPSPSPKGDLLQAPFYLLKGLAGTLNDYSGEYLEIVALKEPLSGAIIEILEGLYSPEDDDLAQKVEIASAI